ncbi:MAG TPA: TolC family protein [Kofleriaceae bacterium]|jgi:outer membrane protein
MKSRRIAFALAAAGATLGASSLAFAQPKTPAPAPQVPAPTGPDPAQPDPNAGTPQTSPAPSWLPGVEDVTGPEAAAPTEFTLTLDKAVDLAMKQQPSLREAKATADAALARIDSAKVARNPTVTLSASAAAENGQSQAVYGANGLPTGQFSGGGYFSKPVALFPLSASASWRIYDFGQTHANIRAAELNADAQIAAIGTNQLDVRQAVELAYLEAVARQRLVKVAESTLKSQLGHLDQAKRFVAAQAKDPIEVAEAQSNAANAKSALAQAQSNQAIALANLRSAIGWLDPTRQPVVDPNWPVPPDRDPPTLQPLVEAARKHRPEIVGADKAIAADEASLDAAHAERRPYVQASAQTGWTPTSLNWSPDPSWTAQISLVWQLWDGGKSRADSKLAAANLLNVGAQRDALLVSLTASIDLARSQIIANKANVDASQEAVTAARAQLQLAEARYAQGLGSQIELADAQTAVTTAEGNLVQAQWQLADAWAQLRRQIGGDQ